MKLIIVESPAKAKTISKYLGDTYIVKASIGHIRDLPKSNKSAIDIKNGFSPHYIIVPGKEKIVSELRSLAKKADDVLLATDPDREGEAIAWHLTEVLELPKPKTERMVFHEITKEAIEEALAHSRTVDMNLVNAQQARRVLDRIVGYDLSGLIWKKVRYGLSAGRVQSPALRIIVEREREIKAFRPEAYWVLRAETKTASDETLILTGAEEPKNKETVERVLAVATKKPWLIKEVTENQVKRAPRPPFITSTLQQAASSRLGFAPSRTMMLAQRLYEAGNITYMRTDSTNLSEAARKEMHTFITKEYGGDFLAPRTYATKSKNAQEAHEAIRPSNVSIKKTGANAEQRMLYALIWQRALASQMADARLVRTKITARYAEDGMDFAANGSRLLFAGWLAADPEARGEDVELPKVKMGDALTLINITSEEKATEPPPRYTEAGLVKELERRGIGRPSTYATIVKTIEERGYVDKINKSLKPTDTGEVVSSFLESNFPTYISDSFTAEMENKLDDIAEGKRQYEKVLGAFYKPFAQEVMSKNKMEKITTLGPADEQFRCPVCDGAMIIKLGRAGKFLSCARYPDCMGARTIEGTALDGPKETGEKCPQCKTGMLVERDSKNGKFIACNNYPKCKYVKRDEVFEKQNSTGVLCPQCRKGFMSERKGRFGVFYGCSSYPECKYAIKARPTGRTCDDKKENGTICSALMMEGTKTIPERCSDKTCPNHNPHKLPAAL